MELAERVVITGAGVVSPCGTGLEAFQHALASGADGISELQFPWETGAKVNRAGVVRDFDLDCWVPDAPPMGRASQLAVASGALAFGHAGLDAAARPDRIGVVVGTAMGDATEVEEEALADPAAPGDAGQWMRLGNLAERVRTTFGLEGPSHVAATACAAGNHAIAWCADLLRHGAADAMLAVGADTVGFVDMLGFSRLLLQAPRRCQPFDLHRKGTVLSEGAGALVLETLTSARRRGAPILAEVAGWGLSCDAGGAFASKLHHTRAMHVAFARAMRTARAAPEEIQHVSAHGSGTRLNDQKETLFLKEVLGPHARAIPVSSIKSMIGHTQGAAAMLEAIACVLTLNSDIVFPTTNYEAPDPACDLDYVPNAAREQRVDTILSNAFGVGGNNALVIFRRWSGA